MDDCSADELEWRDTYFILFDQSDRPTLTQVEAAITDSSRRLKLENLEADDDGMFESVLVQAPQDNAALEISYETGEAVMTALLNRGYNAQPIFVDRDIDHVMVRTRRRPLPSAAPLFRQSSPGFR